MRWLDSITDSMNMNSANSRVFCRTGKPGVLQLMGLQRVTNDLVIEQQQQQPILYSCRRKEMPQLGWRSDYESSVYYRLK